MEWDMSSDGWGEHSGLLWWYIYPLMTCLENGVYVAADVNVLIWDFVKFNPGIALFPSLSLRLFSI